MYVEYLDIPQIPENLLLTNIEDITSLETQKTTPNGLYTTYHAPAELYEYVKQGFFNNNVQVRYQVMNGQLPIHVDSDYQGVSHVYNYCIITGGDSVKTRWWEQSVIEDKRISFDGGHFDAIWGDEINGGLLYETVIEPNRWHKLTVNVPHDISKLDYPRASLRVWTEPTSQSF